MRSRRFIGATCLLAVALLSASGQFGVKKEKPAASAPPTTVTLQSRVPSLALVQGSDSSQEKDGVRISVQTETYRSEAHMTETTRQVPPPHHFGLTLQPAANAIYVERTYTPHMEIKPNRLIFHIHISNELPHVFRGAGIVVQYVVAGKSVNVDPSAYGDLLNVIIPPRGEQDITIMGPPMGDIPSPTTIGLFLYDVVTKMDQAGNITAKQNFEWYYSYRTQDTDTNIRVPAPTTGWQIPQ